MGREYRNIKFKSIGSAVYPTWRKLKYSRVVYQEEAMIKNNLKHT